MDGAYRLSPDVLICCVAGWRWVVTLLSCCEFSADWEVVALVVMSLLGHPRGLVAQVIGLVPQLVVTLILRMMPWWVDGALLGLAGVGVGLVPVWQVGLQLGLLLLLARLQVGLVLPLIL